MASTRSSNDRRRGRRFPVLGEAAAATPASTQRWFVTAHSTRPQFVKGRLVEWPSSLVHAKRMGSIVTACGVPASTWPKLFHLPFPSEHTEACAACAAAVWTSRD